MGRRERFDVERFREPQADLPVLRPAHLGDLESRLAEVELDLRAGAKLAAAFDPGAAARDVAKPHRDRDPAPVKRSGAQQLLARLALGDGVEGRFGLRLFGLEDGTAAAVRSPQDRFADEFEADPAFAHPAHDALGAVASVEQHVDLLADARFDLGPDHRSARGDVDHRDILAPAAEDDRRALDDPAEAILEALVGDPRFLALDRDLAESPDAGGFGLRLGLARNEGGFGLPGKDR
jgi:hypothetical protein